MPAEIPGDLPDFARPMINAVMVLPGECTHRTLNRSKAAFSTQFAYRRAFLIAINGGNRISVV
jgi:hypothetical protein